MVAISSPFRRTIAALRRTIAALRRTIPLLRSIPAHFDAPYSTFRRTIPTTLCCTTLAHFYVPNPQISSHRTRTFCRTIPRGTVAKRGSVTKLGLVAKQDTIPKRGVQLRNGVQLQSRVKSEKDAFMMSGWTPVLTCPQLFDSLVRLLKF